MKLQQDIVNGKLIATGRGGNEKNMPWCTVVFDIKTDDLIDCEWYFTEEDAKAGHDSNINYFSNESLKGDKK